MKQKLIPYKGNQIDKKKIVTNYGPFLLAILAIAFCAVYLIIFTSPSNRLKSYLKTNGYSCNSTNCIKSENNKEYSVNYKNGELNINTQEYSMVIGTTVVNLHENNNGQNCTYKREDSKANVNSSTNNDGKCDKRVAEINDEITKYRELLFKADVNIDKIGK
jgi:hypothetical protein